MNYYFIYHWSPLKISYWTFQDTISPVGFVKHLLFSVYSTWYSQLFFKINVGGGGAGYIKDAVYCRIGVYWSWIIHFRYFEKTTNIWPIFHFFSLLHILSSVKFKVEDRVNFCGHLRIWNIRSKLCHHFKFTDPGFTGLHWAILHAQKEACAEIPVCLVSGLQNNRTDYPVSHISNPIHSPIVFIFKSSSSYQRRWLARDWWKATTQRVGTVYHGR